MAKKSDPATTIDAQAATGENARPAQLALVWLNGAVGVTPLSLAWGDAEELTLGRDAECGIHLPNKDVSRRHATLRREAGTFELVIADLDSRNGTRVNGQRVRSARLHSNDVVRIGGCTLVVTEAADAFSEVAPGLFGGVALQRALSALQKAAQSELAIVLEGETGTGKEVVARAIHAWSRRPGSFVAINCAALPQGLAEAELFGYRRGAFTGAERASLGFFRSAHAGTLLLDEVSDLPLTVQAKLLRTLEQKEVQPLGEALPVAVDVRVVVAGQSSLFEAVKEQRFRADLLARLNGLTLQLPPLRQRRADILPLFLHFMRELRAGSAPELEPDLIERLALHDWPFNVRELVQLARRLAVLQDSESVLRASHLPSEMTPRDAPALGAPVVDLTRLVAALQKSEGNVTRAAAELGISRQRAYRLLEEQAVDLAAFSGKPRPKH